MKIKSLLLTVVIGAGLACGLGAQGREQPGEMVQVKSLPASVQQTINQKAAGGQIVRVKREDDANGRWNYEVVVKRGGKNGDWRSTRAESSSGRTARKNNRKLHRNRRCFRDNQLAGMGWTRGGYARLGKVRVTVVPRPIPLGIRAVPP